MADEQESNGDKAPRRGRSRSPPATASGPQMCYRSRPSTQPSQSNHQSRASNETTTLNRFSRNGRHLRQWAPPQKCTELGKGREGSRERMLAQVLETKKKTDAKRIESERRHSLGRRGRLREDGNIILEKIKAGGAKIYLRQTPISHSCPLDCHKQYIYSNCAHECRAYECLRKFLPDEYPETNEALNLQHPSTITGESSYSIRIDRRDMSSRVLFNAAGFYHIECFECMVDIPPLIPDMFAFEDRVVVGLPVIPTQWGLMIRKWHQHRGAIDLDKIASYIEAEKSYWVLRREFDKKMNDWRDVHFGGKCASTGATGSCDCPPKPEPLTTPAPVLEGYVTEGDGKLCNLSDVVRHDLCEEMGSAGSYNVATGKFTISYCENETGGQCVEADRLESNKSGTCTEKGRFEPRETYGCILWNIRLHSELLDL